MQPKVNRAGGCLLVAGILAGFAIGLLAGNAMLGVWIGTAVGTAAAVGLWLVDRSRD